MADEKKEVTKIDHERLNQAGESMDSDEVNDMFCESCFKDGIKNVPAVVFCVDCVSFFCKICLKFHTKFLPDHSQQSQNDMPKDFCQENCTTHQNEIVKYFCKKCDCFACSNCKLKDHDGCESVHYVPTLLNEFEEKREYLNFKDMLQSVEEKIQETKLAIEHGYSDAKQSKGDIKSVIQEYKENTAKMFDDLDREVANEIDKISAEDEKNLAEISIKLSGLESSFIAIKAENESKKVNYQRCKIFMMVKNCCNEIKSIKSSLENLDNETEIHKISYEPANIIKTTCDFGKLKIIRPGKNRKSANIIKTTDDFGKLKIIKPGKSINSGHKSEDRKQAGRKPNGHSACLQVMCLVAVIIAVIAALIYGDIYYGRYKLENLFNAEKSNENHMAIIIREEQIIIAEADISRNIEYTPSLLKLCHLHKNYLIALDDYNDLLLLISTVDKKIVSDFQPENWPLDITKVGENKVAVIFYNSSEIHIIQINNMHIGGAISWSVAKKVKTELAVNPNRAIAYRNEKVFIFSQKEMSILDLNGNTLKTISFNKTDEFYPWGYLTIRKTDESLHIISLPKNNSLQIIHVAPDEVYETSFSHMDLQTPTGIAADDRGNVYVCGYNSNNIYVLTGDLTKGEVLLDETDRIKHPMSIAYSNEDKKLFIYSPWTHVISVFKSVTF